MSIPRITETDILLINEWLTELETNPAHAIASRTGDETAILANQTKQLLKEQEAEIRQLRLALDIAKGTCKGIKYGGGQFADMPTMQSAT